MNILLIHMLARGGILLAKPAMKRAQKRKTGTGFRGPEFEDL
jgi:hypothetical protein